AASSVTTRKDPNTEKKGRKIVKKDTKSATVLDASSSVEVLTPDRDTACDFNCPICLDTTYHKEMKLLPCSHGFHQVCIDEWLRRSRSCPFCRKALPPPLNAQPPPREVNQAQRFEQLQVRLLMFDGRMGNFGHNLM
ncbi:hypothetical protein AVEN_222819-1, partial [Araneus ventricosus]